jgi:predicted RNA-binding Zn ribbon-like protein
LICNLQKDILKVIVKLNTNKFIPPSGELFFDLVNTVVIKDGKEADLWAAPEDVFAWAASARIVGEATAGRLMRTGVEDGDEFFENAKRFRNALRGMAHDLVGGKPVRPGAIVQINKYLKLPFGYNKLAMENGETQLRFEPSFDRPESLLAPVAADAARLLTEGDPSLVKQCESDQCVLFFYDSTKNHSRRWCSMGSCGNREKVKAYYRRQKTGDGR